MVRARAKGATLRATVKVRVRVRVEIWISIRAEFGLR